MINICVKPEQGARPRRRRRPFRVLHEVELGGGVSEVTLYVDERRMFRRTNRTKQGVGGRLQRRQDLHRCYLPLRCPLYDFFTATQLKHSSFVRFILCVCICARC